MNFIPCSPFRQLARGLLLAALGTMSAASGAATDAGFVLHNVKGYTLTSTGGLQHFDALQVDAAGKVVRAGSGAEMLKEAGTLRRIDGKGRAVLPGLIDAHGHVLGQGHALLTLDLRNTRSLAEALTAVQAHARKHAAAEWVQGRGWNQVVWKLGRFPTARELDGVVRERPVWLTRVDGHAGLANSLALARAGITPETPDPAGGRIERDAKGAPTGVLIDAAMRLVERQIPPPGDAEQRAALDAVLAHLRSVGVTSAHEMGTSRVADALYREYSQKGLLTTRVAGAIAGVGEEFTALAKNGPLKSHADDRYSLRMVKLFADGALGSRGAALLAPYRDAPETSGLLFKSRELMQADVEKVVAAGFQVAAHAIGDAANRQLLDVFAALQEKHPIKSQRHRIEHAQVVSVDDIPRFGELGIVASMQPIHATSDMNMAEDRIGADRLRGAYAWRRMLEANARLVCGSDFPVEPANPFLGLHAAVTRQDTQNRPQSGWLRDQALSLTEALRCFTLDAAWSAHQEDVIGSLEPGKWADFILLDRDPFTMPAKDLHRIKVKETWVAGRQVFQRR